MTPHNSTRLAVFTTVVTAGIMLSGSAYAAPPDGLGPWADSVLVTNQGMRNDGSPVLPERSDPTAALGVAENTQEDGTFYSLGIGGSMTLAFQNGISAGAFVVESTNEDFWYPTETAMVEISADGLVYHQVGNITKNDNEVEVPENFGCAQFIRITDTSDPDLFETFDPTADGYDVDGVSTVGENCGTFSSMKGGGKVDNASTTFTHGFQLDCDAQIGGNFQMNWGKGNKFHLEDMLASICWNDPAIDAGQPYNAFNSYVGVGVGKYNGVSGYHIYMTLTDAGEPGLNDTAKVEIRDATDAVIYSGFGMVKGNHQALE